MNRITHINIEHLAEEFYTKLIERPKGRYKTLKTKIASECRKLKTDTIEPKEKFYLYLNNETNLKKIITSSVTEYSNIISEIDRLVGKNLFHDGEKKTDFGKTILTLFGYEDFRTPEKESINEKKGFSAKWLTEKLAIKVCPYCNMQYTFTTPKKAHLQLDHFYSKDKYPYLSMSFYNLIPACAVCNHAKTNKEFSIDTHIHPYEKSFSEKFTFKVDKISESLFLLNRYKNHEILEIKIVPIKEEHDSILENHDDAFDLKERYKVHTDIVAELYWKSKVYPSSYKKDLIAYIHKYELPDIEINRFITGNYTDEKDFHKRPLSKLTHDIAEELGLLP